MASPDAELISSLAYINQRSAPTAAALRDLIRTLAREANHVHYPDAAASAAADAVAALDQHAGALDAAGAALPGADPGSPGHVSPGSKSTAAKPVKNKGAR